MHKPHQAARSCLELHDHYKSPHVSVGEGAKRCNHTWGTRHGGRSSCTATLKCIHESEKEGGDRRGVVVEQGTEAGTGRESQGRVFLGLQ